MPSSLNSVSKKVTIAICMKKNTILRSRMANEATVADCEEEVSDAAGQSGLLQRPERMLKSCVSGYGRRHSLHQYTSAEVRP